MNIIVGTISDIAQQKSGITNKACIPGVLADSGIPCYATVLLSFHGK